MWGSSLRGGVESVLDTTKLVVDVPLLAANVGVKAGNFAGKFLHSVCTGEDKMGLGNTLDDANTFLRAFMQQQKYDWEHPEEYQDRMKRAESLRHELEDYEAAFNAEEYHHRKARNIGYWSAEAL